MQLEGGEGVKVSPALSAVKHAFGIYADGAAASSSAASGIVATGDTNDTQQAKMQRMPAKHRGEVFVKNLYHEPVCVFVTGVSTIREIVEAGVQAGGGLTSAAIATKFNFARREGRVQEDTAVSGEILKFDIGAGDKVYVTVTVLSSPRHVFCKDRLVKGRHMYVVRATDQPREDAGMPEHTAAAGVAVNAM
jgi:hypothetical protein